MSARRALFAARDGDGTGTTPQDARLAMVGLLPSTGVLSGLAVTGSTSGANMKYNVTAGTAACARGAIATDGVYLVSNDSSFQVDSGAPSPASGSRWDIVWIRARNTQDGFGDPTSLPDINVTVGVASASAPTKPYAAGTGVGGSSVPAGALVLAESLIGANIASASAATITRVAKPVATRGGIIPCVSSDFYPANPVVGQYIDDTNLGLLRWDGSAWQTLGKGGDTGWQTIPTVNSGYNVGVAQFRIKNGDLRFRVSVNRKSGQLVQGETVFALGVALPTSTYRVPFVSSHPISGFLALSQTGVATIEQFNASGTTVITATSPALALD